jgi:oligoribonuclease NrnB/cAMP/cGMP phosphodiesterase (DHH superfamily)
MNIKLFTHTDLDGVGCAILAYLAFGKENVAVEYCNYDDIDLRVSQFLSKAILENMIRCLSLIFRLMRI